MRDHLARKRTELANERTLLAYVRTALGFFIVGVPAVWWLEMPGIQFLGALSLVVGLVCVVFGVRRYVSIKSVIDQLPG